MAYMYKNDEDLQKKLAANASGGSTSAAGGVISGGGGAGGTTAPIAAKPSPFVGIKDYLKANANQAQALSGGVAKSINSTVNDASNSISNAGKASSNAISGQAVSVDNSLLKQLETDPTKVDINAVNKMRNAASAAPKYVQETDEVKKLREKLANVDTEEGRRKLVGEAYNAPQRSRTLGTSMFDNMLLSTDPNAKKTLSGMKNTLNPVLGKIKTTNEDLSSLANQVGSKNATTAKAIKDAIKKASGDYSAKVGSDIDKRIASVKGANTGAIDRLKASVAGKSTAGLSDADLGLLGIDRATADKFVNDENAMSQVEGLTPADMAGLTRSSLATADERARLKALANLAGIDPTQAAFDWNAAANTQNDFLNFNPTFTQKKPVVAPPEARNPYDPRPPVEGSSDPENDGSGGEAPTGMPGYKRDQLDMSQSEEDQQKQADELKAKNERLAREAAERDRAKKEAERIAAEKKAKEQAAVQAAIAKNPPSKNAYKTVGGRFISDLEDLPDSAGRAVAPPPPAPVAAPPVNTAAPAPVKPTMQEKKYSKLMRALEQEF